MALGAGPGSNAHVTVAHSSLHVASIACAAWFVFGASACSRSNEEPHPAAPASAPVASAAPPVEAPATTRYVHPAVERVVAIGDLHGDLDATRRAFRLAGAIDDKENWIGGKLVVVQTGDEIDRGDDDRAILDLVDRLKDSAKKTGGEVIALSGNHEIMNASFDFRYVTPKSLTTFGAARFPPAVPGADGVPAEARGRAVAFAPGGPYAKMIAERPVVAMIGDAVFVHGGVLPKHVRYGIDRINDEVHEWLLGQRTTPPKSATAEDSPVWARNYSAAPSKEDCATLDQALTALKAKRMVMGHTVQRNGINPACDEHAWRIDVGMSKAFGGPIQVLELRGDAVKVLKEP